MIDARHFEVRETLRNGSEICIRALRPDDGERMAEAFGKLDPESIYTRFFGPKAAVTDADFRLIREMDFDSRVALIATVIHDGHEVVIASSSYSRFDATPPRSPSSSRRTTRASVLPAGCSVTSGGSPSTAA